MGPILFSSKKVCFSLINVGKIQLQKYSRNKNTCSNMINMGELNKRPKEP